MAKFEALEEMVASESVWQLRKEALTVTEEAKRENGGRGESARTKMRIVERRLRAKLKLR